MKKSDYYGGSTAVKVGQGRGMEIWAGPCSTEPFAIEWQRPEVRPLAEHAKITSITPRVRANAHYVSHDRPVKPTWIKEARPDSVKLRRLLLATFISLAIACASVMIPMAWPVGVAAWVTAGMVGLWLAYTIRTITGGTR